MKKQVLLLGESWVSSATHYKGFDHFGSTTFHLGAMPLVECLKEGAFELTYMPVHEAVDKLPFELAGLQVYDAIILSDIGANSLLLHPDVWLHGKPVPNRLKLLRDWTAGGGGLMMIGGYLSFQGIDGKARWFRTPVEDALPVTCLPHDDRIEVPEGFSAEIEVIGHPILAGLGDEWPLLLGANEVSPKPGAEVLARLPASEGGHPLLVVGSYDKGRSIAWTSDIGPHWVPAAFSDWSGYGTLWKNCLGWLTRLSEG